VWNHSIITIIQAAGVSSGAATWWMELSLHHNTNNTRLWSVIHMWVIKWRSDELNRSSNDDFTQMFVHTDYIHLYTSSSSQNVTFSSTNNILTLWLTPTGYNYKASCARPGYVVIFNFKAQQDIRYSTYMLSPTRLSVCPSVTWVDQSKTVGLQFQRITKLSPYNSPIPLVFDIKFHPEILRG